MAHCDASHKKQNLLKGFKRGIRNESIPSPATPATLAVSRNLIGVAQNVKTALVLLYAINGPIEDAGLTVRREHIPVEKSNDCALFLMFISVLCSSRDMKIELFANLHQ